MAGGIGLLSLLFAASLIAVAAYGVVYEREAKILAEEAQVAAQLQAEVLKSELEKQRSVPAILAMDIDLIDSIRNPSPQHSLAISKNWKCFDKIRAVPSSMSSMRMAAHCRRATTPSPPHSPVIISVSANIFPKP